jgi:F0F1-type ATP synthase assembly protein I
MPLTSFQKANIVRASLLVIGLGYLSYDFYNKGKYGLMIIILLGGIALGVAMLKGKKKDMP